MILLGIFMWAWLTGHYLVDLFLALHYASNIVQSVMDSDLLAWTDQGK